MRFKIAVVLLLMILSTTVSTANPGGKGDSVRSRDCAGSCHGDPSINGMSDAELDIQYQQDVYAGLLTEIQTIVSFTDVSSNNMVGLTLLVNPDGAKDLPASDGWEIITDPNGGKNNYVEIVDSFSSASMISQNWILRAPSNPGNYELYLGIQHGSPQGGVAMTGFSEPKQVTVTEVPENLPRLSEDWEPINKRELGEETVITLETVNTKTASVELKSGGEIILLPVIDDKFTIPPAVNPGVVEWRVILEGEGPTQISPWFRLTAQEPGWDVDEFALYIQSFALFIICIGIVIIRKPGYSNSKDSKYDNTSEINSQIEQIDYAKHTTGQGSTGPPLPEGGLPDGWNMEQWEYYGHEYLEEMEQGVYR